MLIALDYLIKKFGIRVKGILHLGAHLAEEAAAYKDSGATKVIWIEGNPDLIQTLEEKLKEYPNQIAYNVLISDKDNQTVDFYVTNNFQSSSILALGSHKVHHPEVKVNNILRLETNRLDTFFSNNKVDFSEFNFLNIDLQGAELLAIKGLGGYLDNIEYIYTEINTGSLYKGCTTLFEIDEYLSKIGFYRVETKMTKQEWGDAFYIRQNKSIFKRLNNTVTAYYYKYLGFFYKASTMLYKIIYHIISLVKTKLFSVNFNYIDSNLNGEGNFLSKIIKNAENKIVIFDIGANVGKYTTMVLNELKKQNKSNFEIHLFEPQKKCYQALCQTFRDIDSVIINNVALSDSIGQAYIHYDVEGSAYGSLFDRKEILLPEKELIDTQTLDHYIRNSKINYIDLLKIDTEGNEKKVLMGGLDYISPDFTRAIQFEYGGTYLDAGITLKEVSEMLIEKGYFVGKIKENIIEYNPNFIFKENFKYSNYVATNIKLTS